jgi:AGZA family xanthine/uracil permease-like MFS transporter
VPSAISHYFKFQQHNTRLRTEIVAGVTTFVTMAYIIVVNPAILAFAGIPTGPSTMATILTAVFGCLLMGLYARLPIAVAPYMGENAFIAFGLAAMAITWQQRLASVFLAGVAFLFLTVIGARAWLANSISSSMKHSFAVGIGLFLLFIGLYETGIVTSGVTGMPVAALKTAGGKILPPDVPVKIGDLRDVRVLLAIGGFTLMAVLTFWRIRGAILLGILIAGAIGIFLGLAKPPTHIVAMPFVGDYSMASLAFQLDLRGVLHLSFLPILLTLFLMSFLDTLGTLVGVGAAGGFLDEKGDFPNIGRPMLVDAASCMFAALAGTSTSGAFIESATGIREGGRTGLTAIVVAVLFAAALFFIPVAEAFQQLQFAYGPALIMVGVLMVASAKHIRFDDMTEVVPAVATIAMMLFTYNIANGLTAGLVLYPIMKLAAGRWSDIRAGSIVLALLCAGYYVYGLPH